MSLPNELLPVGLLGTGAADTGYLIERSLRFNSADSSYLSRTPSTDGNRKTWTWSGWVKRSGLGRVNLFNSYSGSLSESTYTNLQFGTGDNLIFGSAFVNYRTTTQVFRDASAWYHIVVTVDTTKSTANNRVRIYVNGEELTQFSTTNNPSRNADLAVNAAFAHRLGSEVNQFYFNGYLANVHLIDGQALDPTSFGEFDDNGIWQPIEASELTYGTNGFHLDFADNSTPAALGTDTSGNGNDWDVYNIQVQTTNNTGYSVYFDGDGDRITASNSNLALGSGDFTVECYFKPDTGYTTQSALLGYPSNSPLFEFDNNQLRWMTSSNYPPSLTAGRWYHAAWTRQGSTGRIFLDGVLIATVSNSTNFTNSSIAIGSRVDGVVPFKGWISNLRVVVGTAIYTSTFNIPEIPLAAVTNTKLLTCQSATIVDNGPLSVSLTTVGNTVVSSDIPPSSTNDSFVDVPKNGTETDTGIGGEVRGNYPTFNPLNNPPTSATLGNGNLEVTANTTLFQAVVGTVFASSGKWYAEFTQRVTATDQVIGIAADTFVPSSSGNRYVGRTADSYGIYSDGRKINNNVFTSYGTSWAVGDVLNVALDLDNGKVWFGKNGTWYASGNPAAGTNAAFTGISGSYTFACSPYGTGKFEFNAGQRPFAHQAPSGFKALNTASLPAPVVTKPSDYFNIIKYTGNGTSQTLPNVNSDPSSGLDFSPSFVWIKSRSYGWENMVYDKLRGEDARLQTNRTRDESVGENGLTAFNSDGFTVSTLQDVNNIGDTYVAWNWDAGSSTVTLNPGNPGAGSIASNVIVNDNAGISVVTYSGTGSNATVGHGLGVAPSMVIVKSRSGVTGNWVVYHTALGASKTIYLNSNLTEQSTSTIWNSTAPTSTVFSIGTSTETNSNVGTYVAYSFAPIAGYSAFGSYTGNGNPDGPFVFCNFRPRWIMVKRFSEGSLRDWFIYDTARDPYNVSKTCLSSNLINAETVDDTQSIDILSNGFKIRTNNSKVNDSPAGYLYAAFAENPFALNARAR